MIIPLPYRRVETRDPSEHVSLEQNTLEKFVGQIVLFWHQGCGGISALWPFDLVELIQLMLVQFSLDEWKVADLYLGCLLPYCIWTDDANVGTW